MIVDRVEGRHPVLSALKSGRATEIMVAEGVEARFMQQLRSLASLSNVPVKVVPRSRIQSLARTRAHQGVLATVSAFEYADLDVVLDRVKEVGHSPLLVMLAGVQDPHNLGAVIRAASCSGVSGVIIPQRRSVAITPAVATVAAGALEDVAVIRVANLVRCVETLKAAGMWIFGADPAAQDHLWDSDLTGPSVLVLGGEHRGIPRLLSESCDVLLSIPVSGTVGSYNVSQAAAVMLYEARRQRCASRAP